MATSQTVSRDSRVIFSCGERAYLVKDVVDWALVRGEVEALWTDFQRVAECDRLADEQQLEPDAGAIDAASIAFRYSHDLITAEETERWLEDRGLTLSDFGEYFTRHYWGRAYTGPVNPARPAYQAAAGPEKDRFLADLILGDELDRMAERLSARVAVQAAQETPENGEAIAEERARFLTRMKIENAHLAEWLAQAERDIEWLDEVLAAEVAYQQRVASLVTDKDLERELVLLRLMLTRFEMETVEVDSRDAAAEVVACVRSDGMEMAEVAEESRYPFRRSELLLEDIPPDQQQRFLSAKAGALLEPIPRKDAFEVCRVKSRIEPSLQDATIRERIEQRLVRRHFSELVNKHIDWKLLPTPAE